MPDLTIETAFRCETAADFETLVPSSDGTRRYRVRFERTPRGYDWTCECRGYLYRRTCSHIKTARPRRCGWDSLGDGGRAVENPRSDSGYDCPRCGKMAVPYRYGA